MPSTADTTFTRLPKALVAIVSILVLAETRPARAQMAQPLGDQLGTFLPIGHNEDKNEFLARTLKNEQDLKFRTRVLARRGVVLVEFSLPTCPACDPAAKSIIEALSKCPGRVDYIRLDLNKNLGLSYKYDVPEVPAVLLFKNGRLKEKFVTFKNTDKPHLARALARALNEPGNNAENRSDLVVKNPSTY